MSNKLKCDLYTNCSEATGPMISFTKQTLDKCITAEMVRKGVSLKYKNVDAPRSIADSIGYHQTCYEMYTAWEAELDIQPGQTKTLHIKSMDVTLKALSVKLHNVNNNTVFLEVLAERE